VRPTQLHAIAHAGCHELAPKEWRKTPLLTGDYDLDATILHRHNKDLPHRLELYIRKQPHSAYRGNYHHYNGDD